MATPQQILELRRITNQPINAEPYTDEVMGGLIDERGLNLAAASVWESKAASVAHLVNTSEGGSSRAMGDIHKTFLTMSELYATKDADAIAALSSAPTSRAIERG